MSSSADLPPTEPTVLPRVGALCRVLLQVRLFLAALTLLWVLGRPLTPSFLLAFAGAVFSSWLASHYWDRLAPKLARHPILVGLDVVIAYGILSLADPLGPFFSFTVVTAAIAGLLYRWRGVAYVCTLQVLFYYGALATAGIGPANWTFQTLIGQPAYYPVVGFVGVAIRRLLDEQYRTEEARRNAEVTAAAAEERARLAREMHDSLAKTLRGIAMAAAALPAWLERSTERAAREARGLASAAEIASREARGLITHLRSDHVEIPLAEAVRRIATEWSQATDVPVTLECAADAELPLMRRYEAVAILREALTNVERHADALSVGVRLRRHDDRVSLEVSDDGRGFQHEPDTEDGSEGLRRLGHYGLLGMYERAARADGTLSISSVPGRGTRIEATLPVGTDPRAPAPHQDEAKKPTQSGWVSG